MPKGFKGFQKGVKVNLGKVRSLEIRRRISEGHKGQIPWNKGKTGFVVSEETRRKIGEASKGNRHNLGRHHTVSEETRKKISMSNKGKHFVSVPEERRLRISATMKGKSPKNLDQIKGWNKGQPSTWAVGEKNVNWKGGVTPINEKIRKSLEYRIWRRSVFERDNYTCIWCGAKFIKGVTGRVTLHADHIKPFAQYPELRFAIDNGRTLCVPCHKTTETFGGKGHK